MTRDHFVPLRCNLIELKKGLFKLIPEQDEYDLCYLSKHPILKLRSYTRFKAI